MLASSFTHTVQDGPLIVAAGVAVLVGVLGFLSPCVLPLVPGYLVLRRRLDARPAPTPHGDRRAADRVGRRSTSRVATRPRSSGGCWSGRRCSSLGFSVIFIAEGVLFGSLGAAIRDHTVAIERVLGVVTIVLGLAFMGFIPVLQREFRIHRLPPPGLLGAPLLGRRLRAGLDAVPDPDAVGGLFDVLHRRARPAAGRC